MKINRVTITGADNETKYVDLLSMQKLYPFVEWGILFSKKEGSQRFPSQDIIKKFTSLNLSAHFCGWYSKEVLQNQNFDLIRNLGSDFKRVQLNYNFKFSKGWDLKPVLEFCNNYKEKSIIFQYNKSNKDILDEFQTNKLPSNIHFLYDSSGGRGTVIENIQPTFKNYTGYSGGLDVNNVESICENITKSGTGDVWIDMESGVRTNNEFDMSKVEKVLQKTSFFIS